MKLLFYRYGVKVKLKKKHWLTKKESEIIRTPVSGNGFIVVENIDKARERFEEIFNTKRDIEQLLGHNYIETYPHEKRYFFTHSSERFFFKDIVDYKVEVEFDEYNPSRFTPEQLREELSITDYLKLERYLKEII